MIEADMPGASAIATTGLFGLWLALSVVVQFAGINQRLDRSIDLLRSWDRFALLPAWTFFAPRPGQTDIHLLFRDISDVFPPSPWREVFFDRGMRGYDALWDPQKRAKKVVVDYAQGLLEKAHGDTVGAFRLTGEYICLANYVLHLSTTPFATHRQFAIVETAGDEFRDRVAVMFVSDVHPVEVMQSTIPVTH